jgi:hypothetical protein
MNLPQELISDAALLVFAASGLVATAVAIFRDTRVRRSVQEGLGLPAERTAQ